MSSTDQPAPTTFDPTPHMTTVGGNPYLTVAGRLLWLRRESPDAQLSTQIVLADERSAVIRAEIVLPSGGTATGYGSETIDDFRDFLEKAETKAIGRALNHLGYGLDETMEAPAYPARQANSRPAPPRPRPGTSSPRQQGMIAALAREASIPDDALETEAQRRWQTPVAHLTSAQASDLIKWLQAEKAGGTQQAPTSATLPQDGRTPPPPAPDPSGPSGRATGPGNAPDEAARANWLQNIAQAKSIGVLDTIAVHMPKDDEVLAAAWRDRYAELGKA